MYVDTREDTAVLDALDFDPKCQEFGECDQQATHKCVWSCGCLWMLCGDHAEIVARANGAVFSRHRRLVLPRMQHPADLACHT